MSPKPKKKPITGKKTSRPNRRDKERYRLFAEAYLAVGQPTYLNAIRSAEAAGYGPGYAKGHSYQLVDKSGIRDEMKRLRDARAAQSTIATPAEVLETLTAQMRMLPNKLTDGDSFIPLSEMTDEQSHAVVGYKTITKTIQAGDDTITETRIEYKFVDRTKVAVELAKHHGLFEKDNEQQKPDAQPLVLMTAKPLTLKEWTDQANELQAQMKARQLEVKP